MNIDPLLAIAAFGIGIVVGLTGMGGGALMTPVLVLFFNVPPLTAVSSDLVASAVMKPVGSVVHLRRGTVHLGLVKWLCLGSIPGAFSGVLIARSLGHGQTVQDAIRTALGVALLLAAAGLIAVGAVLTLVVGRERGATPVRQQTQAASEAAAPSQSSSPDKNVAKPKPAPVPEHAAPVPGQTFAWAATPGASAYEFQLFQSGERIYRARVARPRLVLPGRWREDGRPHALLPGTYRWYVWPVSSQTKRQARAATVQAKLVVEGQQR
jgi:hypothetical protein